MNMEETKDFRLVRGLLEADRSTRRFVQERRIGMPTLERLVELTRYCASGRNAQPLRYLPAESPEDCARMFPHLAWAGYFKDWDGPADGERPAAYLLQCLDTRLGNDCLCDDGLQLQAISLGARALGVASCIIKAFDAKGVAEAFGLPGHLAPRYVLALGYPAESVMIEETDGSAEADIRYYRTPDGVHHVPKRPLSELLLRR